MALPTTTAENGHLEDVKNERFDFPAEERKMLEFWDSIDAFQRSMQLSREEGRPFFTFYDGPPFATGLPHYGHILAATIKDTILRYAYAKGYHVERRFGWDCHGLPIEHEIDKKLKITCREDVIRFGLDNYNEECRAIVTRYVGEWESIVKRSGRWIDFKNDYKTMYPSFMESVWWVFKELYSKGLVYQGYKVMPYSTACTSPLSNFEANLNYKDAVDPAVVVAFPLVHEPETSLLVWTTTPWTLPSNLGVTAHPKLNYLKIKDKETGNQYILSENRLSILYKDTSLESGNYTVLSKQTGQSLEGLTYTPSFDCFASRPNNFRVVLDDYVTDETGTGLVHCSPGFGEDDQRIGLAVGLISPDELIPCPIDDSGRFTSQVPFLTGMYFKEADKEVIRVLKASGRLVRHASVTHSYPFCWRSDTPLLYKAIPSWFVRVREHSERLLATNAQTLWVPGHVKEKKFANWLANARDWAISRNRYWGTPIPIWTNADLSEVVVIGSIAELEERTGQKPGSVTDLHRHFIDQLTIPSAVPGAAPLRRIDEVFDCWFESGAVPYASQHYPFEEKEVFDQHFPADFIAEGVDQCRGWFYTLTVLSTLLFDRPPFKNIIVSGLVLAADGKKMSKRLKNYPEPTIVMEQFGADALRLYLINSPVVCAEFLKFKEEGVRAILRDVLIPLVNVVKFFTESVKSSESSQFRLKVEDVNQLNTMDHWILASLQSLTAFVRQEMDAYRLYTVLPKLLAFIELLTNWYVRLNRRRLKGQSGGPMEHQASLETLFTVLFTLSRLLAPFTPFLAERLYQELKGYYADSLAVSDDRSVHFLMYPEVESSLVNPAIERAASSLRSVIEAGRSLRESKNLSLKVPLPALVVLVNEPQVESDLLSLVDYIKSELNVLDVQITTQEADYGVVYAAQPVFTVLGKLYKSELGLIQAALKSCTSAQLKLFLDKGVLSLTLSNGSKVTLDDEQITVTRSLNAIPEGFNSLATKDFILLLNTTLNASLIQSGLARELVNRLQKLRKKAGLSVHDTVQMSLSLDQDPDGQMKAVLASYQSYFQESLKGELQCHTRDNVPAANSVLECESAQVGQATLTLMLLK